MASSLSYHMPVIALHTRKFSTASLDENESYIREFEKKLENIKSVRADKVWLLMENKEQYKVDVLKFLINEKNKMKEIGRDLGYPVDRVW